MAYEVLGIPIERWAFIFTAFLKTDPKRGLNCETADHGRYSLLAPASMAPKYLTYISTFIFAPILTLKTSSCTV